MQAFIRNRAYLLQALMLCLLLLGTQGFQHSLLHDHGGNLQEQVNCDQFHHSASDVIAGQDYTFQLPENLVSNSVSVPSSYHYSPTSSYSARAPPANLLT